MIFPVFLSAENTPSELVLYYRDNTRTMINLHDNPSIHFKGDTISIKTNSYDFLIPINAVDYFDYNDVSGIASVQNDVSDIRISVVGKYAIINNLSSLSTFYLCDISGRILKSLTLQKSEVGSFSLIDMQPGVYVIFSRNKSFKLVVK